MEHKQEVSKETGSVDESQEDKSKVKISAESKQSADPLTSSKTVSVEQEDGKKTSEEAKDVLQPPSPEPSTGTGIDSSASDNIHPPSDIKRSSAEGHRPPQPTVPSAPSAPPAALTQTSDIPPQPPTKTHAYIPRSAPPPPAPLPKVQDLSHPPGYIQNPAVLSSAPPTAAPVPPPPTLAATLPSSLPRTSGSSDGRSNSNRVGHWYWSDAPNLSGGRYVYSESSSPAPSSSAAFPPRASTLSAAPGMYVTPQYDLSNDSFGIAGPAYSSGGEGERDGEEDEWGVGWVWEEAMNWGRAMGNRLAEMEEGVWRWVNRRT